eukprot:10604778-Ditylum_brightwellii.AAC.1
MNIEHTLIQHIIKTIDAKYLNAIRNLVTNMIIRLVPRIFDYMFDVNGNLSPAQLQDLCKCIENFLFDPHESMDTIFTEIN